MAWKEYSSAIYTCRDGIMKAKVHVELNLVKDVKNTKKGFYRYAGQKKKTKDSVSPLINEKNLQQQTWRTQRYATRSLPRSSLRAKLPMSLMYLNL